jgi:hypothetical protein
VLPGEFPTLANGIRHFASFAEANADTTALVANDNERAEVEAAPAFDHFRGTIDENDFLDQFLGGGTIGGKLRRITRTFGPASTAKAAPTASVATFSFSYFSHNIIWLD